VLHVTHMNDVF